VCEEQSLEPHYLLTQLSDRSRQRVVLSTKDLDFLLEVSQPLLLALTTFQGSDSVSFKEVLALLFIGHLLVVGSSLHVHVVHV